MKKLQRLRKLTAKYIEIIEKPIKRKKSYLV